MMTAHWSCKILGRHQQVSYWFHTAEGYSGHPYISEGCNHLQGG
eukprot:SAG11_NODE_41969_length_186_cov_963.804598_1_plen_43_part_10